jgi:hypothetical protein
MSEEFRDALRAVAQAGPDHEEPEELIHDEELEDVDYESPFWAENGYHDDLPFNRDTPDPNKFPGFCCGCGAHHVREAGRMLCVTCNDEFRDIG